MKTYCIRYGKDTLFSQAEKQHRIGAWVGDAVSVREGRMKTYRIRYGKDTLFSQAEKQRRIGAWVGDVGADDLGSPQKKRM